MEMIINNFHHSTETSTVDRPILNLKKSKVENPITFGSLNWNKRYRDLLTITMAFAGSCFAVAF